MEATRIITLTRNTGVWDLGRKLKRKKWAPLMMPCGSCGNGTTCVPSRTVGKPATTSFCLMMATRALLFRVDECSAKPIFCADQVIASTGDENLDIWQYIEAEEIEVVPLYFAAERPVLRRSGTWIMVDDDRLPLAAGETPVMRRVRFRTLGCYPLTGAVESAAASVADIVSEMRQTRTSERQGRLIHTDDTASMEKKQREGYF